MCSPVLTSVPWTLSTPEASEFRPANVFEKSVDSVIMVASTALGRSVAPAEVNRPPATVADLRLLIDLGDFFIKTDLLDEIPVSNASTKSAIIGVERNDCSFSQESTRLLTTQLRDR
jgi:hypothetical protein